MLGKRWYLRQREEFLEVEKSKVRSQRSDEAPASRLMFVSVAYYL